MMLVKAMAPPRGPAPWGHQRTKTGHLARIPSRNRSINRILSLNRQGVSNRKIGALIGVSNPTIIRVLALYGLRSELRN